MDKGKEEDDDIDLESQQTPSPETTAPDTVSEEPLDLRRASEVSIKIGQRQRTPDMAVQGFDGNFQAVHGRKVQTRTCTRELFNFAVSFVIVFVALGACLIMLAVYGFESPGSTWLQTIAAFCLGVFLPNPQVKAEKNSFTQRPT